MAISNFDKKLEILSFLLFLYSKLIRLSLIVEQQGEDATSVRQQESEALILIDALRGDMIRNWNGQADILMQDLRAINEQAQRKVRELESAVKKVEKLAEIIGVIDKAINLIKVL